MRPNVIWIHIPIMYESLNILRMPQSFEQIIFLILMFTKAEFAEEGTFFANRSPSLRIFVNKRVGIWRTKPT